MLVHKKLQLSKDILVKLAMVSVVLLPYFLPRMHERYFYLTYLLILITSAAFKYLNKYIIIVALLYLINLYHYWWFPFSNILKEIFSIRQIEIFLCFLNNLVSIFDIK